MQKESLLFFSFPSAGIFGDAKVRKNERNAKGKLAFLFISECQYLHAARSKGIVKG